jgi:hypothetical protein
MWPRLVLLVFAIALGAAGCGSHEPKFLVWKYAPPEERQRDLYACDRERLALGGSREFWIRCMEARGWHRDPEAASRAAVAPPAAPAVTTTPFERLTERRRVHTQVFLRRVEAEDCPLVVECLRDYETAVRRIADEVGYTFSSRDELLFRTAREIAGAADDGTITQNQAVNRLLVLDAQIEELYQEVLRLRLRQQQR